VVEVDTLMDQVWVWTCLPRGRDLSAHGNKMTEKSHSQTRDRSVMQNGACVPSSGMFPR